jgi:hypothetical protein
MGSTKITKSPRVSQITKIDKVFRRSSFLHQFLLR